jgi:hypothetical protein
VGALAGEAERMSMKKPLVGFLLMLAASWVTPVQAQETSSVAVPAKGESNVAAPFATTSASHVNLFDSTADYSASRSFALATPENAFPAEPSPASPPAAKPRYIFGDRDDYRWQLSLGLEFFRFQSKLLNASLVGLNTTVTYFTNDWFALEGNLVTGFAPQIYDNEHVKFFSGAGGIRIGSRRARFEPWGHALVGGAHLQPQTAGNSKSALAVEAGLGLDYRVNTRLSLRVEGDWVRTQFFNDAQNNFQGVAAVVFHF